MIQRKKKFLGAIIGGAISAASAIGGAAMNANAQRTALRKQQQAENLRNSYITAQNLTSGYANQDYADDFQNKVYYRCGGSYKRKKYTNGGGFDWASVINGIANAGSSLGSSAITAAANKNILNETFNNMFASTPKTNVKPTDYQSQLLAPNYMYLCGGTKHRKRK